jgi:hypothetical protein
VVTSPERIAAKQLENNMQVSATILDRLKDIEGTAYKLADAARKKMASAEKSAGVLAGNIREHLYSVESSAQQLADRVRTSLRHVDLAKHRPQLENMLDEASKKLRSLEKLAGRIGIIGTSAT